MDIPGKAILVIEVPLETLEHQSCELLSDQVLCKPSAGSASVHPRLFGLGVLLPRFCHQWIHLVMYPSFAVAAEKGRRWISAVILQAEVANMSTNPVEWHN